MLNLFFIVLFTFSVIKADDLAELDKKWTYKFQQLQDHFARNISILINEVETLKNKKPNNTDSQCGGDWVSYLDTKCFQVLNKKGTEEEAKANCSHLESTSTLITINSKEEQTFLSNLLEKSNTVSENAWIGFEFSNKSFKWVDGSETKYLNWDENALKDGSNACVQMSLGKTTLGKWTDDSCKKKFLIACQKKASSKSVLTEEVDKLSKNLIKQQQSINEVKLDLESKSKVLQDQEKKLNSFDTSTVPIGYIYTQFPNQSAPLEIWPSYVWTDVTHNYAGLFFRAEGGSSSSFGNVQSSNQSAFTEIQVHSGGFQGSYMDYGGLSYDVEQGKWTVIESKGMWFNKLSFFESGGENRPRNTAIRMWKRTK